MKLARALKATVHRPSRGERPMDTVSEADRYQRSQPAVDGTGISLRRVTHSEWIKLRSLRSTGYLLLAAFLSVVGVGVATAAAGIRGSGAGAATDDPLGGAAAGLALAEMFVVALGVLTVTGEYASGQVRTTLTAVPRRHLVVAGKAVVVSTMVFVVAMGAVLLAFLGAWTVLRGSDASIGLTGPGVVRGLVGAALYLAVVAVTGVGFGWLFRSTAGGFIALFAYLSALPVIGFFLPTSLAAAVVPLLPRNAGIAVLEPDTSGLLPPWAGLALFTAYALVVLATGAALLSRRDG